MGLHCSSISRIFIIHGYGGRPDGGWKPWVRDRLKEKGYDVTVPAMPDADHPRVDAWTKTLREAIGIPRSDDVLIGHSLGCIAIVRYLETLRSDESVGRCIFVAGFYEDLGEDYAELRSFLDYPVEWEAVKQRCSRFEVIHSDDDTSVPTQRARDLAAGLGVPLELHTGYGHFSGGDGVEELPLLVEKLRS